MTTLDTDVLIADAHESTGLTDFGDDTLPARVALVVDRLNSAELDDRFGGQRHTRSSADSYEPPVLRGRPRSPTP